jgi:hypothetical protein
MRYEENIKNSGITIGNTTADELETLLKNQKVTANSIPIVE